MTREKKPPVEKKPPNREEKGPKEIGAALALLDFNGGNQARTARQLGIPRKTLNEWANNKRGAKKKGVQEARTDYNTKITNSVGAAIDEMVLATVEKIKKPETKFKEAAIGTAIFIDKYHKHQNHLQYLQNQIPRPADETPVPDGDYVATEKLEYEKMVANVIQRSKDGGEEITREQAIASIISYKPEARAWLLPEEDHNDKPVA